MLSTLTMSLWMESLKSQELTRQSILTGEMDLLLQTELTLFQFDGTQKSSLHLLKNTLSLSMLMTE